MNGFSSGQPGVWLEKVSLTLPLRPLSNRNGTYGQTRRGAGKIEHRGNKRSVSALRDINLTVPYGARLAVVGVNGSGKTSLLRVIAGIYQPTSGRRVVNGRVAAMLTTAIGLNPRATGIENILFAFNLYGIKRASAQDLVAEISEFSGLGEYLTLPISTYSTGMRGRLSFSIVTSLRPDVLVIDEALATGDHAFQERARDRILDLLTGIKVLVLASHSLDFISEVCDRAICLESGQITCAGSCEEAWESYLGVRKQNSAKTPPSIEIRKL